MFKSKKFAAVAGVVGGFALIGAGAVQAVGAEGHGACGKDSKGNVRCVQVREYQLPADNRGKVRIDNDSKLACSGSGGEVACVNGAVVRGEKS
ncbi:hypothetical protein GCM10010377_11200 [Streptomyces viridiviolaceus]|uniref:Secreted protein n=1 Tax=Streptomyces viridiviolaceus TaxID=68282 RepID=A0ABW2E8I6_9ACTN|nr:hypothetical protein [Streptomyces viridiviolaceus]GHB23062.1 hypothetical protein GCM10010377_11200 [Streptomyces viridiviolaceus]